MNTTTFFSFDDYADDLFIGKPKEPKERKVKVSTFDKKTYNREYHLKISGKIDTQKLKR